MTVVAMRQPSTDVLLPLAEVRHRTRLSKSEIEQGIIDGSFPAPATDRDREPRWHQSAINTWIMSLPRARISWRSMFGVDADGWPE